MRGRRPGVSTLRWGVTVVKRVSSPWRWCGLCLPMQKGAAAKLQLESATGAWQLAPFAPAGGRLTACRPLSPKR